MMAQTKDPKDVSVAMPLQGVLSKHSGETTLSMQELFGPPCSLLHVTKKVVSILLPHRHFPEPLFRQSVCRKVRRDSLSLRHRIDLQHRVIDGIDLLQRALFIPAQHLAAYAVDHAPTVSRVIRRIENAALLEGVAMPRFQKLVVGSACNDFSLEPRNGLVIDNAA